MPPRPRLEKRIHFTFELDEPIDFVHHRANDIETSTA